MIVVYVSTGMSGSANVTDVLSDSFYRVERLNGKKHMLGKEIELREYIVGDGSFSFYHGFSLHIKEAASFQLYKKISTRDIIRHGRWPIKH